MTYTIDTLSNLTINGFTWTNTQIKEVLGLSTEPKQLSFKSDGLYSYNKFLDKLPDLEKKLKDKYVKSLVDKQLLESTQNSFTESQNE